MNSVLRAKWSSVWFYGAVAMCLLLVVATWFRWPGLQFLNLKLERNFAAWWSGILLMLVAMHAFDGWVSKGASRPRLAWAWLSLSAIAAILSLDEIGSLHERVDFLLHLGSWGSLVPFAAILLGLLGSILSTFWTVPGQRPKACLTAFAFSLFGVVAMLEFVGDVGTWTPLAEAIRATTEEATELLAMLVLLKLAMTNTQGLFADRGTGAPSPTLEILAQRRILLVAGAVAAPVVAYVTVALPHQQAGHPADWFAAVAFMFAALAAIRRFLMTGEAIGLPRWGLFLLCCAASVGTTLDPLGSVDLTFAVVNKRILLFTVLSLLAWIAWTLDPRCPFRMYGPALGALALTIGVFWSFQESLLVAHWMSQWVACTLYHVNASEAQPLADGAAQPLQATAPRGQTSCESESPT